MHGVIQTDDITFIMPIAEKLSETLCGTTVLECYNSLNA